MRAKILLGIQSLRMRSLFSLLFLLAVLLIGIHKYQNQPLQLIAHNASGSENFDSTVEPTFLVQNIKLQTKNEDRVASGQLQVGATTVRASLAYNNKQIATLPEIHLDKGFPGQVRMLVPRPAGFRAGKYRITVGISTATTSNTIEQDFTWGVLALNANQSSYVIGEQASLGMAVLDDHGKTLCDAQLELKITDPLHRTSRLANYAQSGGILLSPACADKSVTDIPDYLSHFTPTLEGIYELHLTAITINGTRSLTSSFTVSQQPRYTIKRATSMRIYPYSAYKVTLTVIAREAGQALVEEKIPKGFNLSQISQDGTVTQTNDILQTISWATVLQAGQKLELSYFYNAPLVSPEFYLLGPLTIWNASTSNGSESQLTAYQEPHSWQIAADAACSATSTGTWTGAIWSGCTGGGTSAPSATDTVTINSGVTVTLNTTTTIAGLTFAIGATAAILTHDNTNPALTVNGTVSLGQPTASVTNAWNINAGTSTVSGLITFAGSSTTTTQIAKIVTTTGTLNANGGITFTASDPATKIIDMSGGAGNLHLKGSLTVPALSSTLTAGTTSTFDYYDTLAQTINFFSAGSYNNLATHNSAGATLGAIVTTGNVSANVSVVTGTFKNGGFAITGNSSTFSVSNGATFSMSASSSFPTGFTAYTFGATSTVQYLQTSALTITAATYGNLDLKGAGTVTMTFPAATITVAGNISVGDGTNATTATAATNATILTIGGNATTLTPSIFTANGSNTLTVGGSWTNTGTFNNSSSSVTFNSSSIGKSIIAGSSSFFNVIFNNSSGGWTPTTNAFTINGSLTVTAGTLVSGTVAMSVGGTISVTGIFTISSSSGTKTFNGDLTVNVNGTFNNTIANVALTIPGNISNSGTFNSGTGIYTLNGTTKTVTGTLSIPSINVTGSYTNTNILTVGTALSGIGTLTNAGTASLNLGGTCTLANLVASVSGNTISYNSTSALQTVKGTTYHHLTIADTGQNATLGAATIINGNLSISSGTLLDGGFQITGNATGTLTMAANTFFKIGSSSTTTTFPTLYSAGNISLNSTSTVNYQAGSSAQTISSTPTYGNLTIAPILTATFTDTFAAGTVTINGNFLAAPNRSIATLQTLTITMAGAIIVPTTGTTTITATGGTAAVILDTNTSNSLTTGVLAITANGTLTAGSSSITLTALGAAFTNAGTFNYGTSTVAYTGNGSVTVLAQSGLSGSNGYYNLSLSPTITAASTYTFGTGANTVNNNFIVQPSAASAFILTVNMAATITVAASGTTSINGLGTGPATGLLNTNTANSLSTGILAIGTNGSFIAGSSTITLTSTGAAFTNTGTFTYGTSTIQYAHATSATILGLNGTSGTNGYYNLQTIGAGTYTLSGTTTVNNNLAITSGTFDVGSALNYALAVKGNWNNSGIFTARLGTVTLSGISTQTLSGTMTVSSSFYNLIINNASGTNASDCEITSYVAGVIFGASATSTNNLTFTTASTRVQYTSGSTYTFTNINWNGLAAGTPIYFRNSTSTGTWLLKVTGTQTAVSYINVSRSDASSGNAILANNGTNTNCGNNTNWTSANTPPNTPTSLGQTRVTGGTTLNIGDWTNETQVQFSATASDTDNPDTEYLCVEKKPIASAFVNTEDSCGTGVAYSGTGITVLVTLSSQTDNTEYHWQARSKDAAGAYSAWVSYGANLESARDYGIDTTAPTIGTVYDGTSIGSDATQNSNGSLSSLSANWSGFSSTVSGLLKYQYSIGTTSGTTNTLTWTDNGSATSVTASGLTLQTGQVYFFNIRAVDNAVNTSAVASSDGQYVTPTLTFSVSATTLNFTNVDAGNSYQNTQAITLTTSTNANNGYVIKAYRTSLLTSSSSGATISDFAAGTYSAPALWPGTACSGTSCGLGYTSSDTSIQALGDLFATGAKYAPFNATAPGDIVADHTATVSGNPITAETFTITTKIAVSAVQKAGNYSTAIVYTAIPQY